MPRFFCLFTNVLSLPTPPLTGVSEAIKKRTIGYCIQWDVMGENPKSGEKVLTPQSKEMSKWPKQGKIIVTE